MVTFADLFLICPTESANNQKLMLEYEKFQEMQSKMMKMQEEYERQLIEKEESKQRDMERQTEYYETKLQEMTAKLEQVDISPQSQYMYIITKFIVVTGIMQRTPFCSEFPLSQGTSMFLISAKENLICQFFCCWNACDNSSWLCFFKANDESREQNKEYEETKKQIEEDSDREILDIKNNYEIQLRREREENIKLKGETGIMKKKVRMIK